ncbi:MAG: 4-hydroxy-tetrahydrodipicolinate reductase [Chlamydiae bacterium]|nr:4-hydroxy-tetrahydrodipicolinate reductase [Chlamydiota bacterium]
MKVALFGYGKMGKKIEEEATEMGVEIVARIGRDGPSSIEEADVCLDFSHGSCVEKHLLRALELQKPILIGTTGWEEELEKVRDLAQKSSLPVLYAPNCSLGIILFNQMMRKVGPLMSHFPEYEVAGVEFHHNQKVDVPSGTAKMIGQTLAIPTPFASVRCGSIPGKHVVLFDSPFDTITFSHEARNRKGFARGALTLGKWLTEQKGWVTLDDWFGSLYSSHHPV